MFALLSETQLFKYVASWVNINSKSTYGMFCNLIRDDEEVQQYWKDAVLNKDSSSLNQLCRVLYNMLDDQYKAAIDRDLIAFSELQEQDRFSLNKSDDPYLNHRIFNFYGKLNGYEFERVSEKTSGRYVKYDILSPKFLEKYKSGF